MEFVYRVVCFQVEARIANEQTNRTPHVVLGSQMQHSASSLSETWIQQNRQIDGKMSQFSLGAYHGMPGAPERLRRSPCHLFQHLNISCSCCRQECRIGTPHNACHDAIATLKGQCSGGYILCLA